MNEKEIITGEYENDEQYIFPNDSIINTYNLARHSILHELKETDLVLLNKKQVDYLLHLIALSMSMGTGKPRKVSDAESMIKDTFYNLK